MKHQYFGDVNDYRKYGLLRTLQRVTGLRLGVWWMLTPDDGRSDGRFTEYLRDPKRWRRFDSDLFDALAQAVGVRRSVDEVASRTILPGATFADGLIPDRAADRGAVFSVAREQLAGSELLFVDPDNGLEVSSCPAGRRNSSKYVQRSELAALFQGGQSLVVYQHFRREERSAFIARMSADIEAITGAAGVSCFRTSNVAFFVIPRPEHETTLREAAESVAVTWRGQIQPWFSATPNVA
jgi:hypothetical protein